MKDVLREFQRKRLPILRNYRFGKSKYYDQLTLLAYTFPEDIEGEAFNWIEFSVLSSWRVLGKLKTVIVANRHFGKLDAFASQYEEIEVQIEANLKPGKLGSMSVDLISNLCWRFNTQNVLVIQDDGWPLRDTLGDFLGRFDYVGAPIFTYGLHRTILYGINLACFNGGFSLRSKRFCRYVSRFWNGFAKLFMDENSRHIGEDFFYCFLARLNPYAWLKFRFPSELVASRFATDTLGGHLKLYEGETLGFHGKDTAERLLAMGKLQ